MRRNDLGARVVEGHNKRSVPIHVSRQRIQRLAHEGLAGDGRVRLDAAEGVAGDVDGLRQVEGEREKVPLVEDALRVLARPDGEVRRAREQLVEDARDVGVGVHVAHVEVGAPDAALVEVAVAGAADVAKHAIEVEDD